MGKDMQIKSITYTLLFYDDTPSKQAVITSRQNIKLLAPYITKNMTFPHYVKKYHITIESVEFED